MLSGISRCPRCERGAVHEGPAGYICDRCSAGYPILGGVPWLFRDPQGAAAEWRARLALLLADLRADARACQAGIADAPGALTRQRLELLAGALDDHAQRLASLLEPLGVDADPSAREALQALRTRLPGSQGLTNYYANIHRDWCWGEAENEATLGLLVAVADGDLAGARIAVLGSGAGRLAYDLYSSFAPALVVAMDLNPLLLAVAREMYAGRRLELYELPIAPRSIADHAVLRRLHAPAAADRRLVLVAGDALQAPFAPGAFDVVVTPWFIDIVEAPFPALAARVNALLKTGGRWLNLGSVAFASAQRAQQFSLEETLQLAEEAGFDPPRTREEPLPYMRSPASRHARVESTVAWSACKRAEVPAPAAHEPPVWLADVTQPVPLPAELRSHALATRIHAFLMSLVDGQRSVADIARVLVEQKLMRPEDATPAVRAFLARMYEDLGRRTNF